MYLRLGQCFKGEPIVELVVYLVDDAKRTALQLTYDRVAIAKRAAGQRKVRQKRAIDGGQGPVSFRLNGTQIVAGQIRGTVRLTKGKCSRFIYALEHGKA